LNGEQYCHEKTGFSDVGVNFNEMRCVLLFVVLITVSIPCFSAKADSIEARALSATCTGCHGFEGKSLGGIPRLAGLDKDTFVQKMLYFRSESAAHMVMHKHARGYTLEQIKLMAEFFQNKRD